MDSAAPPHDFRSSRGPAGLQRRSDIDGLRAIAVLPIVLFHAGLPGVSGGFVGVDIFFVISGYLITAIVLREIEEDRFTLAGFYKRRILRIFPALSVLLIVALALGATVLLPFELKELGKSAIAATMFVANLFFWRDASYFSGAAETRPLLHTWSLGVEEQFYIFYPIGLLLLFRWHRQAIIVGLASSLAAGVYLTFSLPSAAFYLLPSRAWELGVGAAAAVGFFPESGRRTALAMIGLVLIAAGIFFIRPNLGFPVPAALAPAMGAALVIAYGQDTPVHRALGKLRWFGLISYSLYLWHWPIITFYRLTTGTHLGVGETVALLAASLVAASLSYYFVEQPFLRSARAGMAGLALAATGIFAIVIMANSPRLVHLPPDVARVAAYDDYTNTAAYRYQFRPGPCFRTSQTPGPFRPDECLSHDGRRTILVTGDSHAAMLWRAISLRYPNFNVLQATTSGCRIDDSDERCGAMFDYVLGPGLKDVDVVVLASRWMERDIPGLLSAANRVRAAGVDVVILGPASRYDGRVPSIIARSMLRHEPIDRRVRKVEALDREIGEAVRKAGFRYLSIQSIEREHHWPMTTPDGTPMRFDYGHYTLAGAEWIVARLPNL
jgi:peptidoglycan/LPS O-acetylase OafA/YrhL